MQAYYPSFTQRDYKKSQPRFESGTSRIRSGAVQLTDGCETKGLWEETAMTNLKVLLPGTC